MTTVGHKVIPSLIGGEATAGLMAWSRSGSRSAGRTCPQVLHNTRASMGAGARWRLPPAAAIAVTSAQ